MVEAHDNINPKPDQHFADANEAKKVMYIHQPPGMPSACFGSLMAARANHVHAAGIVINGRFRDVQGVQSIGLPV